MSIGVSKSQVAMAIAAMIGAAAMGSAPGTAIAAKTAGTYVTGDFHNHTTCSDGSISMQKVINKVMDTPWGLDWFVQAGHGGNGNRNCTLAEDGNLATPAYPVVYSPANLQRCWDPRPRGRAQTLPCSPRASRPAPRLTRTCGAGSQCRSTNTRCWNTWRPTRMCRSSSASKASWPATSIHRCR